MGFFRSLFFFFSPFLFRSHIVQRGQAASNVVPMLREACLISRQSLLVPDSVRPHPTCKRSHMQAIRSM